MQLEQHIQNFDWASIVFLGITFSLCLLMLFIGFFLGEKTSNINNQTPFESGIRAVGSSRMRFSIKFYVIAVLFVIFDVEAVFLYIWAVSLKECGWIGFIEAAVFIINLIIGLIYVIKQKALHWSPKK